MADSCATCYNYRGGTCRGGLPKIIPEHGNGTFWATVDPDDWCVFFTLTAPNPYAVAQGLQFTTGINPPAGGNNGDWYLWMAVGGGLASFYQNQNGSWVSVLSLTVP